MDFGILYSPRKSFVLDLYIEKEVDFRSLKNKQNKKNKNENKTLKNASENHTRFNQNIVYIENHKKPLKANSLSYASIYNIFHHHLRDSVLHNMYNKVE